MQTDSFRIWTLAADSISKDDICYTKSASTISGRIGKKIDDLTREVQDSFCILCIENQKERNSQWSWVKVSIIDRIELLCA